MKKIILGTSDTWSMSPLSWHPSEPAYYIEDWRIFCSVVCLAETGLRAIWAEQHAMYTRFLSDQDGIYCTKAKEWLGYYCPNIYCGLHHPGGGCSCILLLLHLDFYRYTHLPHSHTYVGRAETRRRPRWRRQESHVTYDLRWDSIYVINQDPGREF